jgi:hypothetical protein
MHSAVAPLDQRAPLHLVETTRSCVYCEAAKGPGIRLVADGPGTWCCEDTTGCEQRILADQRRDELPATPTLEGPIAVSDGIGFPLDAALARYLIFGKSGAGKTNADTVLAEEFLANGVPTVILDFLGNMWGLRSSADGKEPGHAIAILGGRFGDLPLYFSQATMIAEIVGSGVSAIIDLSMFAPDEQQLFCAEFLDALLLSAVVPLHVIVEEAETIAPARSTSPEHFRASTASSGFARKCRNGSIGWTFSTQRVDHTAHDLRQSASVLVAMQNSDEDEQRSITGQVASRAGKAKSRKILATLAGLKRGEAWLLADSAWLGDDDAEAAPLRFRFRLRSTYDSARPKKFGEVRELPTVRAEVDLEPFRRLRASEKRVASAGEVEGEGETESGTIAASAAIENVGKAPEAAASSSLRPWRKGRAIMLELLRRSPQQWTPRPILAAITGLDPATFDANLRALLDDELVQTRRGRGGGVSLTIAGYKELGVYRLPQGVVASLGASESAPARGKACRT